MSIPRLFVKPRKAQPFYARHPWVFAGAIDRSEGNPNDGDEVELVSTTGNFIAYGLFNSRSKIVVRLYSWNPEERLTREFWRRRLQRAIQLRDSLRLRGPRQGCRLVFSEGDLLSGLALDAYGDDLVLQLTSLGLAQRQEMLVELLRELLQPRGVYLRTEKGIGQLEGLPQEDRLLWGEMPPPDHSIIENGCRFAVNLAVGQKTGYYLDQRDNRRAVSQLAAGKRVLDAFCYSGGFGITCAKAGATQVDFVDVSDSALNLAKQNAEWNEVREANFIKADVFRYLETAVEERKKFDLVILDPPKFARNRNSVSDAIRGYRQLQSLGIRLLEPGGILVSCCCSGAVSGEMLLELLGQLATEEKRDLQLLQRLGHPPDHPVSATCWESTYLKCFIVRVG
jgi:23S rRNA (cytosine1962-C5)-methyltransferase